MLFVQTTVALLGVASVALAAGANAHELHAAGSLHKRAENVAQELEELDTLPAANKKAQQQIAATGKQLTNLAASNVKAADNYDNAVAAVAKASASVDKAQATVAAQVKSASASLAAYTASAAKSISSVASAVSKASSSYAAASSSYSSSSAAAASSSAAANAKSGCYPVDSFVDNVGSSSAFDETDCADFCGSAYDFIALVEPDSPPATCYCPDITSYADLKVASAPSKCDATYGSTDGKYVTIFKL